MEGEKDKGIKGRRAPECRMWSDEEGVRKSCVVVP